MNATRSWRGYVFIATSVDGFIARHDGDIDWLTNPPAVEGHAQPMRGGTAGPQDYETFMNSVDYLVMGRGTYEKVLTFGSWPYAAKQVIVVSTTLPVDSDDRVTVARSIDEVTNLLAAREARAVYVDGGQVIQEFLRHDLIDELTITHAPVLLGDGLPLFGRHDSDIKLVHAGTSTSDSGMTSSRYHIVR